MAMSLLHPSLPTVVPHYASGMLLGIGGSKAEQRNLMSSGTARAGLRRGGMLEGGP